MAGDAARMVLTATQKLVVYVALVLAVSAPYLIQCQQPPPNYSYDDLPDTSFSCAGRQVGGYYADVEAGCQMFHVCGASQGISFRFLCPNDTVFDQQHLVCADWFQVICDESAVLYSRNFEIFKKDVEQEVAFNEIDEDNLPSLDDYDYDFRDSSSGGGFFGNAGRSLFGSVTRSPVTRRPVTRARVTRPPVTAVPVTLAPITRRPVTPAPTTRRPVTSPPVTRRPQTARPAAVRPAQFQPVTPRVSFQPVTPRVSFQPVTPRPRPFRPVTPRPRPFQPVTPGPRPFRPVTSAPVRVTPAPPQLDQTTAATSPRPSVFSSPTSFRDSSTFVAATSGTAPSVPTLPPFLPTPLVPIGGGFRPTRLPPLRPSSQSIGSFSSPRPAPQSPSAATAPSVQRGSARVTLGEFRSTTVSPFQRQPARVTLGEFRTSTPRPVSSASAISTFSTPKPLFTTTGEFPFGFTSVPRQSFAFGNGRSGFSFGTGVRNPSNGGSQSSAAASSSQGNNEASSIGPPAPTAASDFNHSNEVSFDEVETSTSRSFRPRTTRPTTRTPQNAVAVSSAAPFFRQTPTRAPPRVTPTRLPTEPTRTVNPVAARFFGSNVVPETTPTEIATTPVPFRPRGRGSETFRLASVDATSNTNHVAERTETTTSAPEDRFSATIPTRSPSTRLSSESGEATTTARPRGFRGRGSRRRRPQTTSSTGAGATTSRRRGSRRRGGIRRLQTRTTVRPTVPPSPEPIENVIDTPGPTEAVIDGIDSGRPATPQASSGVQQALQRPSSRGSNSFPPPRSRTRVASARGTARTIIRTTPAPTGNSNNEIETGAASTTRRPLNRARGRGSRRFNPRIPGGELNPGKLIRTGSRRISGAEASSRIDLSRGGLARPRQPISPPIRSEFQLELAALTDELGLDEDELELTEEELQLIEEELNEIEEEAEKESFRGIEANNRSIDGISSRGSQRVPSLRGTTARPVSRRITALPRRFTTTTPPPDSTTPHVIRKKIRVRGRPSRRPSTSVSLRRRTTEATTTPAPPTDASTLPTNKEASNLGRQNGFFLRPKLQLSSALPTDLQTRRLNDVNSFAAERTGRSRNTSPIAFNRVIRSTTTAPPTTESRLSDILFASTSPGARPVSRDEESDYDYQYYDTDFRTEHAGLLDESESLFQALSRKTKSV